MELIIIYCLGIASGLVLFMLMDTLTKDEVE